MQKKEKEQVMVIIKNLKKNDVSKKQKLTIEYCKEKSYDIVHTETIGRLGTFDLLDLIINKAMFIDKNITKVVVVNLDDLTRQYEELFIISTTLKKWNISIESINDGVVGKDVILQLNVDKGDEN